MNASHLPLFGSLLDQDGLHGPIVVGANTRTLECPARHAGEIHEGDLCLVIS